MVDQRKKDSVLITGVTGYIGSQVCKKFLEEGIYNVAGTVRDINDPKKIQIVKDAFKNLYDQLELVSVDLNDSKSIEKAIAGRDFVIHTASPFPLENPKDEQEVIGPALNGTLAVL